MIFNVSLFKARFRGRKGIRLGKNSKLLWGAKILNLGSTVDCIRTGSNCIVGGELFTFAHGGEIVLGSHCYIGQGTRLWSGAKITLGNYVLVSHGVSIMDNLTHPLNHFERRAQFKKIMEDGHPTDIQLDDQPIYISDDVWIGANSVILRGIRIGERAIVGAGSVVVDDVAADSIVAGNPAKFIRFNR